MFRTAAEGQVLAGAQPFNVRALERLSRNATPPALLLRILGIRIGATPQGVPSVCCLFNWTNMELPLRLCETKLTLRSSPTMRVIHKQASYFLGGGRNSAKIHKTSGNWQ